MMLRNILATSSCDMWFISYKIRDLHAVPKDVQCTTGRDLNLRVKLDLTRFNFKGAPRFRELGRFW